MATPSGREPGVPPDDLLLALTYYHPYVSGLSNFARDIAEGLAARGQRVRVITTRHDSSLPERETIAGVTVQRAPVLARLGKGTVSPAFPRQVIAASKYARVTNLHLPMLEAGPIARLLHNPAVITYHCDVSMPQGALNALQQRVIDASSRMAIRHAAVTATTSTDYARHSRMWPQLRQRQEAIPPPCKPTGPGAPSMRETSGLHVGFLGRIVEEKGLEHLVRGFRELDDPQARLLIAGEFADVAGGSVVDKVHAAIGDDQRVRMLGFLPEEQLADFYASLDVFALPSVNSFEAFGIVQVVAMLAGVPVLASNLPGVRVPVQQTGFGEIAEPGDAAGITKVLRRMASDPPAAHGADKARELFSMDAVLDGYQQLLERHAASRAKGSEQR